MKIAISSKKTLLMDGQYECYKSYYTFTKFVVNGKVVGTAFGFFRDLLFLLRKYPINKIVIAFDTGCKKKREISKIYKTNREKKSKEVYESFDIVKEMLKYLPVTILYGNKIEADDLIAKYIKLHNDEDIMIYASDHDYYQLINEKICLLKDMKNNIILTIKDILNKFGVEPIKLVDVYSICGDKGDNVIGIDRIGIKTACKLIQKYGSLENVIEKDSLCRQYKDKLLQNKRLISHIIEIDDYKELKYNFDLNNLVKFFEKLKFKSFLENINYIMNVFDSLDKYDKNICR